MKIRREERQAANSVDSRINKMYFEDRMSISEITHFVTGVTKEYVCDILGTTRERALSLDEMLSL